MALGPIYRFFQNTWYIFVSVAMIGAAIYFGKTM